MYYYIYVSDGYFIGNFDMFVNYVSVINNIVFVNVCIAGDYCIIC